MNRDQLIDILARFSADEFENQADAKRMALNRSRCGSPFHYKAMEVNPDHFLVVMDDEYRTVHGVTGMLPAIEVDE